MATNIQTNLFLKEQSVRVKELARLGLCSPEFDLENEQALFAVTGVLLIVPLLLLVAGIDLLNLVAESNF